MTRQKLGKELGKIHKSARNNSAKSIFSHRDAAELNFRIIQSCWPGIGKDLGKYSLFNPHTCSPFDLIYNQNSESTMRFHPIALLLLCGGPLPTMAATKRRLSPGKGNKSTKCSKSSARASLSLLTDTTAEETSWELVDASDTQIAAVNRRDLDDGTRYEVDFGCLDTNNCYEFTIFDCYGDGLAGGGEYTVTYDGEALPIPSASMEFDFEHEETIRFGDACSRRRELSTVKSFRYGTSVADDDKTLTITITVEEEQNIHVDILDWEDPNELVVELWDGKVTPGDPLELTFDAGNIHVPTYKASISSNTGSSTTFTLAKVVE